VSEHADQFEEREDGTDEAEDEQSDEGEDVASGDEGLHRTST
jgi:hypothetical protein